MGIKAEPHSNQYGFSILEAFLIFLVLGVLVAAGMFVWRRSNQAGDVGQQNTQTATFESGIYYRLPKTDSPEATLSKIGSKVPFSITMSPVDFDILRDKAVYAQDTNLVVVMPNGSEQKSTIPGIYQMARPTLSPDGTKVAVQATATQHPEGQAADFRELGIYVVDLNTKAARLISKVDPTGGNEAPEWFHTSNKIAYSSFSPTNGIDLHIYNLDSGKEESVISSGGELHVSVSKDDKFILNSINMQIFDTASGQLVRNLKAQVITGLKAAGYQPDSQYDGHDHRGSFPLDGDFSPDGAQIVFDGAVVKDGQRGIIICTINQDGSGFKVVRKLLPVNPDFSNNNNFSQINPIWL